MNGRAGERYKPIWGKILSVLPFSVVRMLKTSASSRLVGGVTRADVNVKKVKATKAMRLMNMMKMQLG